MALAFQHLFAIMTILRPSLYKWIHPTEALMLASYKGATHWIYIQVLTDTEAQCANIEWELLAVVFDYKESHTLLESTAGCWNKGIKLILTWQGFTDLHAKAASSGLREMLD